MVYSARGNSQPDLSCAGDVLRRIRLPRPLTRNQAK
jgi:hypothetical protein